VVPISVFLIAFRRRFLFGRILRKAYRNPKAGKKSENN